MDEKLQMITHKIYSESIDKAKKERDVLLAEAEKEKARTLAAAEQEAKDIIQTAKKDAEQLRNKIMSEIRMAGGQAISLVKQELIELISGAALSNEVKSTFDNLDFTKTLITEMITKGDFSGEDIDFSLTLPERYKPELETFFKTKLKNILESGVELKFQSRMDGGFKIGPKDNSFVLSFSDRDFNQFFQSFLRPRAKEILFPGDPQ